MGYSVTLLCRTQREGFNRITEPSTEIRRRTAMRCIEDESFSHWKFSDALVN